MTQAELNRQVARATGETVMEIGRRGFSIADPDEPCFDPEPDDFGRFIDWDAVDAERYSLMQS
jgi:hypothetical protein